MKSRPLSIQRLIDVNACENQVQLFREKFGEEVRVTVALCVSVAHEFDFLFAAQNLLSGPAYAECDEACDAAWAECEKVCARALAECDEACDAAWAECEKASDAAYAECDEACDAALAECEKVCARAFAELYINDI